MERTLYPGVRDGHNSDRISDFASKRFYYLWMCLRYEAIRCLRFIKVTKVDKFTKALNFNILLVLTDHRGTRQRN